MWAARDFSYRKLRRKAERDGITTALTAAMELSTRSVIAPPICHRLFDRGWFRTVSQEVLLESAVDVAWLEGASEDSNQTPFAVNIGSGYVLPTTGLVLTSEGDPIAESVGPAGDKQNGIIKSLVRHGFVDGLGLTTSILTRNIESLSTSAKTLETVCPLSYRYINYYHWTIETLPRIRYARAYEEQTGDEVTYLIWSDAPPYVTETLDMLGVAEQKVERATNTVYQASNVVVPSFPEQTRADYRWFRDTILENVGPEADLITPKNNVYISRSNAIERQVVNESEVVETLSAYGFESYELENQSVAQNVLLFHEADVVVGAHGAGLTDLIYCDDTTIIELFGSKVKDPYERLAETMGVEYRSLVCEPVSTDIRIDVDELTELVKNHS